MRLTALVIATTLMAYAAPVIAQGVEVHDHSKKKDKGTVRVGTVSEAKVTGFAPVTGPVGVVVTISGANFLQQTELDVVVPRGALSKPFTVTTEGGSVESASAFQVIDYSSIIAVSPDHGPVGTVVGGKPGTDSFYIIDGDETTKLEPPFQLTAAPAPTYAPTSGPVGTRVTISGSGFGPRVQVKLGNKLQNVVARTASHIDIVIDGPPGAATLYVVDYDETVPLDPAFTVVGAQAPPPPASTPCAFTASPVNATAGQVITIDTTNCNVKNVKHGWFKGAPVQIVSVTGNAVTVKLPPRVTGTDNVSLETDDGKGVAVRVRTSNKITVKTGY